MDEKMIAPCGMNCSLCIAYQFKQNDLNKRGFHKKYCPGCIPRGENCMHMADACESLAKGGIRFCFECESFPCKRLKALDKRYRTKYHMSMIENLNCINEFGMEEFLKQERDKWRCTECGATICCHNGLCLTCNIDTLVHNNKYRWETDNKKPETEVTGSTEQLLRNPDIKPSGDVIAKALGEANSAYVKFIDELSNHNIEPVWHYYNDGKAWLAKGLYKRTGVRGGKKETTVFWLSVWNGFFKVTFYIPSKARADVLSLPLDNEVKLMIANSGQMGKLKYFPLVFDLCSDEKFKAVFMLADFRKSIK
ncbi:MAG: DUF3788 family protein [Clostridiales bacterium]|nr:DUF3788 family protein [Clostridiales bacterium]